MYDSNGQTTLEQTQAKPHNLYAFELRSSGPKKSGSVWLTKCTYLFRVIILQPSLYRIQSRRLVSLAPAAVFPPLRGTWFSILKYVGACNAQPTTPSQKFTLIGITAHGWYSDSCSVYLLLCGYLDLFRVKFDFGICIRRRDDYFLRTFRSLGAHCLGHLSPSEGEI
ncbi:hypothetical protein M404DRAFT_848375 [Pisolithus tinctorius Marx 270]|uniref:Uncharacterized protein n=1 Tax=Pisolithus tinctorius Marx 270 TaxID=870435 RepID=A0A0C3NSR0_PISTI|nr:hypothetical protein M404DRAFT_848375 [Pisolithus tinctorius Marx 270]